jgi:adenosine deaminase CECR1
MHINYPLSLAERLRQNLSRLGQFGGHAGCLALLMLALGAVDGMAQTAPLQRPQSRKLPATNAMSQLASNLANVTNQLSTSLATLLSDLDRDRLRLKIEQDKARFCFAEGTNLTSAETRVDAYLRHTLNDYFENNRADFAPTRPFYAAKREIKTNELFRFLRRMPKGGLLHSHLTLAGRMDWVVDQAIKMPNCYVKWPTNSLRDCGELRIIASGTVPSGFVLVSEKVAEFKVRGESFADALHAALSLDADNAGTDKPIWREFDVLLGRTGGFVTHDLVLTNYLLDAFQTLWEDKVYYVELRDSLSGTKDPAGAEKRVQQIKAARRMMQAKHTNFDCRVIVAGYRGTPNEVIDKYNQARQLKIQHRDLIAGFDLIGEESGKGHPLGKANRDTLGKFKEVEQFVATDPQAKKHEGLLRSSLVPVYLHDGESAWADNDNLFDAVLLGTPRIGHAFNLFRYPALIPLVKSNEVVLEICPISNQLLGLTPDLRTHPAAGYLNAGIQCTLSSDDPLYFGNDGLAYDFWMALTAWQLDLPALKKLARNSITYSVLDEVSKAQLMRHWENEWNTFIAQMERSLPRLKQRSTAVK